MKAVAFVFFTLFPLISQANFFVEVAERNNLHPLVLYGIAQQESTKPGYGKPWPWTVNFNGQGMWFESKIEAMEAVDQAFKRGMRNIDIGVMQINMKYHGHRFKTLNEAFDPATNIQVAADILKQFSEDDIRLQIAKYHCPGSSCRKRALAYANKVFSRLNP
ncbi:hypothetical protein THMIRHAS_16920 [Thiosulfatimonas sediminis]|uniref:Uncharacterized protein n=1 Tax=Thiosulfatimonas sediminis TaxID=2675054 RepID=A0A6F8PW26_9GAMM|nr:transglycosylase SLT domain-containing protein [Thiosulfatimonas sediminis]BBP46319.1 hypothetical protein THMIRHAS_16920 [Thiosulfatimonas sediminis]